MEKNSFSTNTAISKFDIEIDHLSYQFTFWFFHHIKVANSDFTISIKVSLRRWCLYRLWNSKDKYAYFNISNDINFFTYVPIAHQLYNIVQFNRNNPLALEENTCGLHDQKCSNFVILVIFFFQYITAFSSFRFLNTIVWFWKCLSLM